MKKSLVFSLLVMLAAWGVIGCKKDDEGTKPVAGGPDRQALLVQLADSVVKPGYLRFSEKLSVLKSKTTAFTAAPTPATLLEARQAWLAAYVEWQKVELFEFGPAENVGLRNSFNIYPTDAAGIRQNISSGSYNFEVATAIAQQGFPALDYLLNGLASDDAAIAQQFASSANHRRYLTEVVARMDQKFGTVYGQWTGAYRNTFVNSTGTDASSSLSRVVNAYVLYFERYLRAGKVGIPAGVMGGVSGTTYPDKIEAYYYRGTLPLQLAQTAHSATQQFFSGRSGRPSFKAYLDALGAKDSQTKQSLSEIISTQYGASYQQLSALGPNLYGTLQTRPADAVRSYDEMQKVVRLLKIDMTSAMGITLTYVDNDGD
ncbi:imelysin family protein [Hymenobacter saemangeumensis]|uniref:Imelysin family protein n=1 Tax=Hymenobacter saemangeumensis TaxID=1084522 RepID=A0ABP8HWN6_9BACT